MECCRVEEKPLSQGNCGLRLLHCRMLQLFEFLHGKGLREGGVVIGHCYEVVEFRKVVVRVPHETGRVFEGGFVAVRVIHRHCDVEGGSGLGRQKYRGEQRVLPRSSLGVVQRVDCDVNTTNGRAQKNICAGRSWRIQARTIRFPVGLVASMEHIMTFRQRAVIGVQHTRAVDADELGYFMPSVHSVLLHVW